MAIEKNSFRGSRLDSELSSRSRYSMSSGDDEFQRRSSAVESDDEDEFDDRVSWAGSDDIDLLELGETGEEFCQVGDQTCSIPFELYDLPGLADILSMDVWNDILTEEERFILAKYLPDVDEETFMLTLTELFAGSNFHFGSPVNMLFDMLKGGLCEPRVALYRQGLNFFQQRQHYHRLQKHQNSMVTNLHQIRDAWLNCRGYSIEEKLQVLNIMKSQKSLMYENMEELDGDSSEKEESGDDLWSKKLKDWKVGLKMGRHSGYRASPALESAKYGKQNPKGTLKLAGSNMSASKDLESRLPIVHAGLEIKSGSHSSAVPFPRQNKVSGYDSEAAALMRDQIGDVKDVEEALYELAVYRDSNSSRVNARGRTGSTKAGNEQVGFRGDEYTDGCVGFPASLMNDVHGYGRNRTVNQLSDIKILTSNPSNARISYDYESKVNHLANVLQFTVEDQMRFGKGQAPNLSLEGNQMELSDGDESFWHSRAQCGPFSADPSFIYGDWKAKKKRRKIGRDPSDLRVSDRLFSSEYRARPSQEKSMAMYMQNGGRDMAMVKGVRMSANSEETESDSSEQIEEDKDDNPLMRSKWNYPRGISDKKSGADPKKTSLVKKDKQDSAWSINRSSLSSRKMGGLDADLHMEGKEDYSLKAKRKSKRYDFGYLNGPATKALEESYFCGPDRSNGDNDRKKTYKLGRNCQLQEDHAERFHIPSLKTHPPDRKRKAEVGHDYSATRSDFLHNYVADEDCALGKHQLAGDSAVTCRLGKKGKIVKAYTGDRHERSDAWCLGCSSESKKLKVKDDATYMDGQDNNDYLHADLQQQADDMSYSKKRRRRKLEDDTDNFEKGKLEDDTANLEKASSEPPVIGMAEENVDLDAKPQKKPFTLLTPTIHTGFSFSVIHLLSAVRTALITLLPEDSLEVGKYLDMSDRREKQGEEQGRMHEGSNGVDTNTLENSAQRNLPSLTVQEIVNRVRSNPGDPCILETQEPLQDLVRGVLKIFSSKISPLGAKGWKPLVFYEKSKKSWSWIGPFSHSSADHDAVEEVTSPESWDLPRRMLVKLVDSFANWLKSGQETLQQMGSLPDPPLTSMQLNLDEKERFRDLRAQKSLTTISPSSEEVRAYFRREEVLRYSIPDRAFSYTAVDGRKSIVAPLRRCGGKPTSKARDHFMLKRDRPPHVTVLCLVRDAAARLPGSIGTRADVCTLIRDSQYIVADVSDAQVNQVVSGALDRLHYERDPCVQFDGERKLWVYLHREREEEDFEDDGTSSTKKWKRQKREGAEPFDQGTVTVDYHGPGEQTVVDLSSDINVEPAVTEDDKRVDFVYYDGRHHLDDNIETSHGSDQGTMHRGLPMAWDAPGLKSMQENKLLCQENFTNVDFDDETFGQGPTAELLSTSLL